MGRGGAAAVTARSWLVAFWIVVFLRYRGATCAGWIVGLVAAQLVGDAFVVEFQEPLGMWQAEGKGVLFNASRESREREVQRVLYSSFEALCI